MSKLNNLKSLMIMCMFFLIMVFEETGTISLNFFNDNFSKIMLSMTIFFFFFIFFINFKVFNNSLLYVSLWCLFIILLFFFFNENIFFFYVLFEFSVIPMLFLVSAWGYSIERIKAMMYMYMYTVIFSLPFLIFLIFYDLTKKNFFFSLNYMNISFLDNGFMFFFVPLLFLVKIPLWGFHFWLPKAHVEASTEGSMILAGIILKLSGVGLVKFSYFFNMTPINSMFIFFFASLSILGALFIPLISLRQTDSKSVVALSSIIHMSVIFIGYVYYTSMSMEMIYLVMVAHGFISPLMFFFLGLMYEKILSRSLYLSRGILKNFPFSYVMWFILCILNMGIPLSMNFLSELFFFFVSTNYSIFLTFSMIMMTFSSGILNMYLFNYFTSGKIKFFMMISMIKSSNSIVMAMIFYVLIFFFIMEEI